MHLGMARGLKMSYKRWCRHFIDVTNMISFDHFTNGNFHLRPKEHNSCLSYRLCIPFMMVGVKLLSNDLRKFRCWIHINAILEVNQAIFETLFRWQLPSSMFFIVFFNNVFVVIFFLMGYNYVGIGPEMTWNSESPKQWDRPSTVPLSWPFLYWMTKSYPMSFWSHRYCGNIWIFWFHKCRGLAWSIHTVICRPNRYCRHCWIANTRVKGSFS